MNGKMTNISTSSVLVASAIVGFTSYDEASMELNPGERSQEKSQQGADSSSVILGGPEIRSTRSLRSAVASGDHLNRCR